jgi:arsenite methyltransferase
VKEYYGKVLSSTASLKTSACTASTRPHAIILRALKLVPQAVREKYYGCGSAVPLGIEGLDLLDLGSGSGQDCYVAASLIGTQGSVVGIDMTEEQLQVARASMDVFSKSIGYSPKLEFRHGLIEDLQSAGIQNESLDMIISNCVVNLSPRKDLVLREAYRALRFGGEFFFSDVYCDRRLPEPVQKHQILWGECISGAMYVNDFLSLCQEVGFKDPRQVDVHPIAVEDPQLFDVVGNAKFFSITFRLFKIASLERLCEDYGQVALYKGSIEGYRHSYDLDKNHTLITGKPLLVCGNTASMLSESWLKKHFQVTGNRSVHYGEFPCGSSSEKQLVRDSKQSNETSCNPSADSSSSCGKKGSCC